MIGSPKSSNQRVQSVARTCKTKSCDCDTMSTSPHPQMYVIHHHSGYLQHIYTHSQLHHNSFGPCELGIAKDPTCNENILSVRGKTQTQW